MKACEKTLGVLALLVLIVLFLAPAMVVAADVDVYAEGAYTDADLVVYIYADIKTDNVLSFGVKLTYNPDELTVASAEKNEDVWYMGDGTTKYSYMDPDTSTAGEVIIIGGKLDTGNPTGGVAQGDRVLLGKVTFDRVAGQDISALSLSFARGGEYKNFVAHATPDPRILDDDGGVAFGEVSVFKRGDADRNGTVDAMDMLFIKNNMMPTDAFTCYADGDRNEVVDAMDMLWIRNNMD